MPPLCSFLAYNNTLIGMQFKPQGFESFQGPELILADTRINFNWQFNGVGKQFCYLDGRRYNNDADFMCRR